MRLFGSVQQRALPTRQQHDKLQKGIAEFFADELELEPLHGYGSPQINLNPPLLNRIARIRLPERSRIAVENVIRYCGLDPTRLIPGRTQ